MPWKPGHQKAERLSDAQRGCRGFGQQNAVLACASPDEPFVAHGRAVRRVRDSCPKKAV